MAELTPQEMAALKRRYAEWKAGANAHYPSDYEWFAQAGYQEAIGKRLSSRQLYQMAHQAGIKEVVDWIKKNGAKEWAKYHNDNLVENVVVLDIEVWQAFLKEKGIMT